MKITIITEGEFQQVQEFKNVTLIEFENQEYLNNGMWIHITQKTKNKEYKGFSVSFDPGTEWFKIEK